MRKLLTVALAFGLSLGFSQDLMAQKVLKEGKVNFEISYPDLPEEAKAYASMLPSEMIMYFKKEMARVEISMGMGESVTITNSETGELIQLMDLMGNKYATKMSKEDLEENQEDAPEFEVEYSDETREIAGYTCKKAVVSAEGSTVDVWYTEDLEVKAQSGNRNPMLENVKGFPMEYSVTQGQLTMVFSATSVEKEKVDGELFEIPDDYEIKTPEEFRSAVGGMGG